MKKMNYLAPDEIWEIFNVKSEDDFREKYLLMGKFHPLVPEIIIEEYKIVERLIYYSYFNYPLIDEAFAKSTRIFEAAVTLKLEILGLKKDDFESLDSKLKRLKSSCSNDLFEQWSAAKKLRNAFAHREAGKLAGIFLMDAFKHNLNLINSVFLESSAIINKEKKLEDLLQQSRHLVKGLFILEYNNTKILVSGARPYTAGILNNAGKSLWVFMPIAGDKVIRNTADLPAAILLKLEDPEINGKGLNAAVSETKETVRLTATENAENIEKFSLHNMRIADTEKASPQMSLEYIAVLKRKIAGAVADFLYEDW